ncbi:MAG: membrane dipeptidase, partial [Bacteroidales bacterium]|nr:membrane dipeptidase [Bacteroidales bacterium]
MAALIGCDHIGLGSDFDGIPIWPADVNGVEDVGNILEALAKHNYSQEDIEKIAGLNFMRLAAGLGIV